MATTIEISYFNTFWLKRLKNYVQNGEGSGGLTTGSTVTAPANRAAGTGYIVPLQEEDWFVEESRIRGGYNNTTVDFGTKAFIVEEDARQQRFTNRLIYSGILNSRTGTNNTNQFPIGEDITRSVDPISGTIQKLYSEDTNLLVFQERKVNKVLIDKDAIYTAEGQDVKTVSNVVMGAVTPYQGNWGISTNPGSFAVYGYQKYFVDKYRSAVLRLSRDGITEISNYGMIDYFRDELAVASDIIGGYDIHNKAYVTSLNNKTISFDEQINGWTSFYSYIPELMTSCLGKYYTIKSSKIWEHYSSTSYNNFYGVNYDSSVTFVFNPQPTRVKTFKTINYEGSNGWEVTSMTSDITGKDLLGAAWINNSDTISRVYSYDEGFYTDPATQIEYRAGFDRKQNTYFASIKNNSDARAGEVIFGGAKETGIKAFYTTVTLQTDATTDPQGPKELFSVGSQFNLR